MKKKFIKISAIALMIFTAIITLSTFSGCKSADDPNVAPTPAIAGTFSITKIESRTATDTTTWTPVDAGCKTSATYTFNSPNTLVYKKSTCDLDVDFTGTWGFNTISKELTITNTDGSFKLDGIVKSATGTSFVLDESAILNASIYQRITFTKK